MDKLTAKDLQRRYRAGERNFAGVDLSGESLNGINLNGINLSGADLSHTDIRGTNFTEANLVGTQFEASKAGTQHDGVVLQLPIVFALAALASFLVGLSWGILALPVVSPSGDISRAVTEDRVFGVLGIVFSLGFLGLFYARGVLAALSMGAFAVILAAAVVGDLAGVIAVAIVGAFAVAVVGVIAVAGAVTFADFVAVAGAVAGTVVAAYYTLAGAIFGEYAAVATNQSVLITMAAAILGIVLNFVVSISMARRALAGDVRDSLIRNISVWFGSWDGTKFTRANLTDASFLKAILKSTDFSQSNLTRTQFHLAKKVSLARLGKTILSNLQVQKLLVTLRGRSQSYLGLDLKGAYLAGADLAEADCTEADLSQANLCGATLERANLTKTWALGTDLREANLTGATLEDWNIDSTTNLDGTICDYVYLLRNQQKRCPSSGTFAPGDFRRLFQEALDT